jgi:hypothetical protein
VVKTMEAELVSLANNVVFEILRDSLDNFREKHNYKDIFWEAFEKKRAPKISQEDIKSAIDYIIDNREKINKKTLDSLIAALAAKYIEMEISESFTKSFSKK